MLGFVPKILVVYMFSAEHLSQFKHRFALNQIIDQVAGVSQLLNLIYCDIQPLIIIRSNYYHF